MTPSNQKKTENRFPKFKTYREKSTRENDFMVNLKFTPQTKPLKKKKGKGGPRSFHAGPSRNRQGSLRGATHQSYVPRTNVPATAIESKGEGPLPLKAKEGGTTKKRLSLPGRPWGGGGVAPPQKNPPKKNPPKPKNPPPKPPPPGEKKKKAAYF